MAAAPLNEEERVFAAEFGARTARRHGRPHRPIERYRPPETTLQLADASPGVERAAALALSAEGPCLYVENQLFRGKRTRSYFATRERTCQLAK